MIFGLRADGGIEAWDGFEIVIEDLGFLVEDFLEGVPVAAEIGDEDFDADAGGLEADLADGVSPDGGATVGQLIAIDAGDDDVLEGHFGDRLADSAGLVEIECGRASGGDVAEAAASGADVAEDHEGGGARVPAFAHVGTHGRLADGVELFFVNEVEEAAVALAGGHFHLQPGRLASEVWGFGI
jgi:hypothetical protein